MYAERPTSNDVAHDKQQNNNRMAKMKLGNMRR